jgi:hypothetical protein
VPSLWILILTNLDRKKSENRKQGSKTVLICVLKQPGNPEGKKFHRGTAEAADVRVKKFMIAVTFLVVQKH